MKELETKQKVKGKPKLWEIDAKNGKFECCVNA